MIHKLHWWDYLWLLPMYLITCWVAKMCVDIMEKELAKNMEQIKLGIDAYCDSQEKWGA